MLRCVECGEAVETIYKDYGKENIRLTVCENCGNVADKYVEYEMVLILIDLLLHKPQAYRHILYNRQPSITENQSFKMFFISTLLDMNMKAYLMDKNELVLIREDSSYLRNTGSSNSQQQLYYIPTLSLHLLSMATLENIMYLSTIVLFTKLLWPSRIASTGYTKLLGTILVSSFGKLFIMLSVIWNYHWMIIPIIGAIVITSNHLALSLYVVTNHNQEAGRSSSSSHSSLFKVSLVLLLALAAKVAVQCGLYFIWNNDMIFYTL